jgi:hypothetical protein
MIVFIVDIVHEALTTICCSSAAMKYRCRTVVNSIYGVRTQSPREIQSMADCLWSNDRFTCPTSVREVSSKFSSCSIVVLMIKSGVQVSICSDWNCRSYSLDIHLWHTTISEWKLNYWLMKSTRHTLPSPQRPSTIVCLPRSSASSGSRQRLVGEVELNVNATQETLIMW